MVSEQLDPDTAPANRSIWKNIDHAALDLQTQALFNKQHVTGRRSYASSPAVDDSYLLPFEVEKSLADDFAFIAACEPQVDFVSAVAIEQLADDQSLVIKLAANEGVATYVKDKFDDIVAVLKSRARKGNIPSCHESTAVIKQAYSTRYLEGWLSRTAISDHCAA